MATRASTIAVLIDQGPGALTAKAMFGEYGLYLDGKLVALVCDDQLYLKPTEAARGLLGDVVEARPYPSAKPCFLIAGDRWEDADWLSRLLRVTAAALPDARPRKARPLPRD